MWGGQCCRLRGLAFRRGQRVWCSASGGRTSSIWPQCQRWSSPRRPACVMPALPWQQTTTVGRNTRRRWVAGWRSQLSSLLLWCLFSARLCTFFLDTGWRTVVALCLTSQWAFYLFFDVNKVAFFKMDCCFPIWLNNPTNQNCHGRITNDDASPRGSEKLATRTITTKQFISNYSTGTPEDLRHITSGSAEITSTGNIVVCYVISGCEPLLFKCNFTLRSESNSAHCITLKTACVCLCGRSSVTWSGQRKVEKSPFSQRDFCSLEKGCSKTQKKPLLHEVLLTFFRVWWFAITESFGCININILRGYTFIIRVNYRYIFWGFDAICALYADQPQSFCALVASEWRTICQVLLNNAVDILCAGKFCLYCHWSSPTHNSTSEFLQLTSSTSCCRTLATSFRPPILPSFILNRPPPPKSARLPASGGSPARGGWLTLSHQLHCLHPGKLHKDMNVVIVCEMKTKQSRVNEGYRR